MEKYKGGHIWITAGLSKRKPKLGDRAFFTMDNKYDIEPKDTEPKDTEPKYRDPIDIEYGYTDSEDVEYGSTQCQTGDDSGLGTHDPDHQGYEDTDYEYSTWDESDYDSDYEDRPSRKKKKEIIYEPVIEKPPIVLLDPEVSRRFNERVTLSLVDTLGNRVYHTNNNTKPLSF